MSSAEPSESLAFDGCSVTLGRSRRIYGSRYAPVACLDDAVLVPSRPATSDEILQYPAVQTSSGITYGSCGSSPTELTYDSDADVLEWMAPGRVRVEFHRVPAGQLEPPEIAILEYCGVSRIEGIPEWLGREAQQQLQREGLVVTEDELATPRAHLLALLAVRLNNEAIAGLDNPLTRGLIVRLHASLSDPPQFDAIVAEVEHEPAVTWASRQLQVAQTLQTARGAR